MDDRVHQIRITTDNLGRALDGVLITDYQMPGEGTTVLRVGPFDTPAEVVAMALDRLEIQLTLW